MRHGEICEVAKVDTFFDTPQHDYSKHLLDLMPNMNLLSDPIG